MATKYFTQAELKYKALFGGAQADVVTDVVTIKAGAGVLTAGALLERGTNGYTHAASTSADVRAVLIDDVDATDSDVQALAAYTGEFVLDRVSCSDGKAPTQALIDGAQDRNIYFRALVNKEAK